MIKINYKKILKSLGIICFYLQMIIFMIFGVSLITSNIQMITIFTNNQLLGFLIVLYMLFIFSKKRRYYKEKGEGLDA